jgi:hypothetical protein
VNSIQWKCVTLSIIFWFTTGQVMPHCHLLSTSFSSSFNYYLNSCCSFVLVFYIVFIIYCRNKQFWQMANSHQIEKMANVTHFDWIEFTGRVESEYDGYFQVAPLCKRSPWLSSLYIANTKWPSIIYKVRVMVYFQKYFSYIMTDEYLLIFFHLSELYNEYSFERCSNYSH